MTVTELNETSQKLNQWFNSDEGRVYVASGDITKVLQAIEKSSGVTFNWPAIIQVISWLAANIPTLIPLIIAVFTAAPVPVPDPEPAPKPDPTPAPAPDPVVPVVPQVS